MKSKGIYYYVLDEHRRKIEANPILDPQIAYEILSKFSNYRIDSDEFVEVPASKLQAITHEYKRYLDFFMEHRIIFVDFMYIPEEKARGYLLREDFLSPVVKIEVINTKFIKEKIKVFNANKNKFKRQPTLDHMKAMKKGFVSFMRDLDVEKIKEEVNRLEKPQARIQQYLLVEKIENERFYFGRNKTNTRLDTNLTNLKSEFKYMTKPGAKEYSHIDMKNSQPFFLGVILSGDDVLPVLVKGKGVCFYHNDSNIDFNLDEYEVFTEDNNVAMIDMREEINRYLSKVRAGVFYDELVPDLGVDRDSVKKNIMKVFFSKNAAFSDLKRILAREYPGILNFMYLYKKVNGYTQFAILLQVKESSVVLDNICKKMVQEGIVPCTIHDSWIVETKDVGDAVEIINSFFPEHPPKLKVDHFADVAARRRREEYLIAQFVEPFRWMHDLHQDIKRAS